LIKEYVKYNQQLVQKDFDIQNVLSAGKKGSCVFAIGGSTHLPCF